MRLLRAAVLFVQPEHILSQKLMHIDFLLNVGRECRETVSGS